MIYIDYEEYRSKYIDAQKNYDKILTEKEALFEITQPHSTDFSKERVSGGGGGNNTFDSYLIAKEKSCIDARLIEAKSILEDRERLLKLKEDDLRKSNNIFDRIYTHKYIDAMKVYKIAKAVGYSEPQVYRYLKKILRKIKR